MTKKAKAIAKNIAKMPQDSILEATSLKQLIPKPLNVLITRPEVKAQQLALLLNEQGISSTCQALFDYQAYASQQEIKEALQEAEIIIFVSAAAVEFAHATYAINLTGNQTCFAVGNATKKALQTIGITQVLSPPAQQEHSEGLLNLDELAAVSNKNVVIFRGNGGREHIATTLKLRGAKVKYIESYQRVWRTLTKDIAEKWQAKQINCIVVTSNDILSALIKYLESTTTNKYWKTQCLWLVVSNRIENSARTLGITHIVNTHSANSQKLCDTLQELSCS